MRSQNAAGLAALAAVTLALAACADDGATPGGTTNETETVTATETETETATVTAEPEPAPTVTVTVDPIPVPDDEEPPAQEAPFPANREPDTRTAQNAALSMTAVRLGVHQGYDRIVVDLEGQGLPGWQGAYVGQPTESGSGRPVELAGAASLQVAVTGVVYPGAEQYVPYAGPGVVRPSSTGIVEEIRIGPLFEGERQIFVGLTDQEPFRIFGLEDPTRVVIDIQHP